MGSARRPVTCHRCGYVTVPVSGFCPRCLSVLPRADETPLWPFAIAGALAVALIGVVAGRTDQVGTPVSAPPAAAPGASAPPASAPPAATASPNAAPATASPSATPRAAPPATPAPTAVAGIGSLPSTATEHGSSTPRRSE